MGTDWNGSLRYPVDETRARTLGRTGFTRDFGGGVRELPEGGTFSETNKFNLSHISLCLYQQRGLSRGDLDSHFDFETGIRGSGRSTSVVV